MFIINPMNNMNNKILHDKVLTAGWDRLACIWDVDTGELLQVGSYLTTLKKIYFGSIFCQKASNYLYTGNGQTKEDAHLTIFSNWLGTMRS